MNIVIRWILSVLSIVLISIISLTSCSYENSSLVKNKAVPAFALQNLQGINIVFPDQFKNQPVIISFWADWCPSCYKEMDDFEVIYNRYHQKGLAILSINIEQDRTAAEAFIDDLNLSYELLLDTNGDIAKQYAVSSLPVAFIIAKDGTLHTRVLGETPPEVFDQIISTLL